MESLSYQQFIDSINNGKIVKVAFQIKDYAHYNYCTIEREVVFFSSGGSSVNINVKLSNIHDRKLARVYDNFCFITEFDEKRKLFKMGRKGTFTLKQIWDRIEFISIDYAS